MFTLAEGDTHVALFANKRRSAFTLAEVLITLGIIGVVAALTLPTLIQKYQEQARVSQLKKAYAILQNAFQMARNEYGEVTEWGDADGNAILDYTIIMNNLEKYIQGSAFNNPMNDKVYSLDGRYAFDLTNHSGLSYQLNNGTILYPGQIADVNCDSGSGRLSKKVCGDFFIVLPNPPKKGYTLGVDLFNVFFTKDGFYPSRESEASYTCKKNSTAPPAAMNGRGCAAFVLTNGNMDYLHK